MTKGACDHAAYRPHPIEATPHRGVPLSYGRIRRGPMAGDAFTQIRNAVFRDSRLTGKAMGIFGNISTHRDGWGITPESISTQMRDGAETAGRAGQHVSHC